MAELLLELLSEEIPARMQARAATDLARLVTGGLTAAGLAIGDAEAFATPRRLTLIIDGVANASPGVTEERKGPRVGAPEAAVQGFLKAAGLKSLKDAELVSDPKKGDYYVARLSRPGRMAADIVAEVVPDVCAKFPWPKSMRWGSGDFRWVRPLKSILCLLDGKVVPFEVAGIASSNETRGHRVLGGKPFAVKSFADYEKKLAAAKVILDPATRIAIIAEDAAALAKAAKLELVPDEALLAENAGLTEWPVVLMGTFDKEFLDVPPECLTLAMRTHQKCFSLRHPRTKKLANKFVLVSNLAAKDGGAAIVAGNEKVIRARLADARFFWQQDLKRPLDTMAAALDGITFHEKLGTQKERVERIAELAFQIAPSVDAVPEDARRAAQLAKADLVSEMVGEFPELQGLMGRYYAEAAGTQADIARAIELHYKPKGPNDAVPREDEGDAVAIAVALADKLDTLVGFWAIGEKPTGSGDPYQLRRAALGVIRIVLENDLRVRLISSIRSTYIELLEQWALKYWLCREAPVGTGGANAVTDFFRGEVKNGENNDIYLGRDFLEEWAGNHEMLLNHPSYWGDSRESRRYDQIQATLALAESLLSFFADRLKVHLREKGARHDLIDAVFALPGQDDLALIVKRVEALGRFLETSDGASLLTGAKRAANILAIEEKKDKRSYAAAPDGALLVQPEERALAATLAKVKFDTAAAIAVENFEGAMRALAELRPAVDAFFDHVTVNTDDPKLRENRLALLSEIRSVTLTVADFSKIAG